MAFEDHQTNKESVIRGLNLLDQLRQIYRIGTAAQELIADYQGNGDARLVTSVNTLFSSQERQELAAMVADIDTLITAWAADHAEALGL